jgi:hypothetical protein
VDLLALVELMDSGTITAAEDEEPLDDPSEDPPHPLVANSKMTPITTIAHFIRDLLSLKWFSCN